MRLEGKVALISGSANGMGETEARLFAREGAKVVVADVLEEQGQHVAASIVEAGGEAQFIRLDVTNEDDWKEVVTTAVTRYGKLDILVNNAGISGSADPDLLSTATWKLRFSEPVRFSSSANASGPKNVSAMPTNVPVITSGTSE